MRIAEERGVVHAPPPGFGVGPHALLSPVLLAPMSGVTDAVFRRQASSLGAGLVISEMVSSDYLVRGDEESRIKAEGSGITPHAVQLAGCDARWMAEAARLAQASGADIIDINMGCPAKRVTGGWAGSALMRDLDHATSLIEAVIAAVSVPVTVKMRLGWDEASINAPELARRAELSGACMVTVHGRTRQQFYKGKADWRAIAAVKAAVGIPVIANGDIECLQDARDCLIASHADGVMIGRAAMGRAWLPGAIGLALSRGMDAITIPPPELRARLAEAHHAGLLELMGEGPGLRHARKHLSAYADDAVTRDGHIMHSAESHALKKRLLTTQSPADAVGYLEQLFHLPQAALERTAVPTKGHEGVRRDAA